MSPDAPSPPIIADRGEFADALHRLRKGHILVRAGDSALGCAIDGAPLFHSFETLRRYELIAPFDNHEGFAGVEYYRITPRGRQFAQRVCTQWRAKPLLQRLAIRLTG